MQEARRITRAFLRHQHIDETVAEDAVLVVSELVSNGVEHSRGELGLRVRCHGRGVRVEVRDSNPAPATLRVAAPDAESGRGLFLVNALAHDWGVSDNGATTWCELRWTDADSTHDSADHSARAAAPGTPQGHVRPYTSINVRT
ncbi:ATP-binding protein [Streptomyces sp. NPDC006711]|uniref:ATP-binding protein n=1 Tax=Streptomyces sp. NPDC006711 TaxID=3364762 RepID=UPI0036BD0148